MPDRALILTLAQVIAAAAWADGELSPDEIASLKGFLLRMPRSDRAREVEINDTEWAQIDIYLRTPVSPAERAELVRRLQAQIRSPADADAALAALEELVSADGRVTPEERAVLDEIRAALDGAGAGLLPWLGRLLAGPLQRATPPSRMAELDDFLRNRAYYLLTHAPDLPPTLRALPDAELRTLALAGALLARLAAGEAAQAAIGAALARYAGIDDTAALAVARAATAPDVADTDYVRMATEYLNRTTEAERIRLLDALFAVALADGALTHEETQEIRRVAQGLALPAQQVNAARDRAVG
jgi:uncharacterized tellurite resistance protein B-like protein